MNDPIQSFGETAKKLARNPLGIIALFIVLVYGIASLVTISTEAGAVDERQPLIYFLVFFPVLVLAVFAWLVSKHSDKLYGPSDFTNEENYMKLMTVASLGAATGRHQSPATDADIRKIVESVQSVTAARPGGIPNWRNQILWVDDRPENNTYEREAFEAIGLQFTLSLSTDDAFDQLSQNKYSVIISDMGRREGPREGYVLLDRLRKEGDLTPLLFYAASNAPQHIQETLEHGGQGCTNNPRDLFEMVTKAVIERQLG